MLIHGQAPGAPEVRIVEGADRCCAVIADDHDGVRPLPVAENEVGDVRINSKSNQIIGEGGDGARRRLIAMTVRGKEILRTVGEELQNMQKVIGADGDGAGG